MVQKIADTIEALVRTSGGAAYITVYEGDGTGIGRQTGRDQWQRNEKLKEYRRFFHLSYIHNGMIIVD